MDRSVYEARWILIVMLLLGTTLLVAGISAQTGALTPSQLERITSDTRHDRAHLVLAGDPADRSAR